MTREDTTVSSSKLGHWLDGVTDLVGGATHVQLRRPVHTWASPDDTDHIAQQPLITFDISPLRDVSRRVTHETGPPLHPDERRDAVAAEVASATGQRTLEGRALTEFARTQLGLGMSTAAEEFCQASISVPPGNRTV